uniref:Uncharacterized protein n=1 Tax=viral metagenome TaxID=1070528 RepID=A0A6H1ZQE4_9ZZZZ
MFSSKYYVFGGHETTPTVVHLSLTSAEDEAKRLARKQPGEEFMVLRAIKGIKYVAQPFIETLYCKNK